MSRSTFSRVARQALDRHGLSPVRHRRVHSAAEAVAFLEEVGDRIVLKPGQGAGSLHINVVSDAEGAARAVREIEEFGYGGVLAEEYLEGPVVSVEAFSHQGRHVVLGVSEYRVNEHFVEWECSVPSDAAQPDLAELHRVTAGVLDAAGLTDGPSHSEFVLTPAGPRLLETHNRLSGAGIPEMVHRATGWDPARLFMTVPLGIDRLPETAPEPQQGAAIRFLDAAPGRITAITGADDLPVPVRRVPAGERAPPHDPVPRGLRGGGRRSGDRQARRRRGVGDGLPPLLRPRLRLRHRPHPRGGRPPLRGPGRRHHLPRRTGPEPVLTRSPVATGPGLVSGGPSRSVPKWPIRPDT
ncbi:hypothetical protein GCM10017562_36250 [Streptomyces roseofulvus]|uniref:ATP-grasp domain-containing protein n=1 Tax=Streptomyces roseofulvus TaxID=33902 RepID=UPI0031FBED12